MKTIRRCAALLQSNQELESRNRVLTSVSAAVAKPSGRSLLLDAPNEWDGMEKASNGLGTVRLLRWT